MGGYFVEEVYHAWFAGLCEVLDAVEGVDESIDLCEGAGKGGSVVKLDAARSHAGSAAVLGW